MEQYIPKSALVAEIDKRIKVLQKHPMENHKTICHLDSVKQSVNSIEVKEVDIEKEYKDFINSDNGRSMFETAKHFFELGMRVNNPITAADRGTAEEIIINLKRVEQDYRIYLTREIEWLRNQVKKGEEV